MQPLIYEGLGLGDFYYKLFRDLRVHGRETHPRGRTCITMPWPIVLVYEQPGKCLMYIPGRKFNIFFALMEALWILAGSGNVDWICFFNENIRQFSDLGHPDFHGAYGLRMRHWDAIHRKSWDDGRLAILEVDQIQAAISKIVRDLDTRQAVISLWDPVRDNLDVSKDYPCNDIIYATQSNGILNLAVAIRSNDLIWGTPHNAIQFTCLLALLAGMTNLRMGKITYFVNNLHVYIDDLYKNTLDVLECRSTSGNPGAYKIPFFEPTTDSKIQSVFANVSAIAKASAWTLSPTTPNSFWSGLLPFLATVYSIIKYSKSPDVDTLSKQVCSLPYPIPELITDFYRGSKNEVAREVAARCYSILTNHPILTIERSES